MFAETRFRSMCVGDPHQHFLRRASHGSNPYGTSAASVLRNAPARPPWSKSRCELQDIGCAEQDVVTRAVERCRIGMGLNAPSGPCDRRRRGGLSEAMDLPTTNAAPRPRGLRRSLEISPYADVYEIKEGADRCRRLRDDGRQFSKAQPARDCLRALLFERLCRPARSAATKRGTSLLTNVFD